MEMSHFLKILQTNLPTLSSKHFCFLSSFYILYNTSYFILTGHILYCILHKQWYCFSISFSDIVIEKSSRLELGWFGYKTEFQHIINLLPLCIMPPSLPCFIVVSHKPLGIFFFLPAHPMSGSTDRAKKPGEEGKFLPRLLSIEGNGFSVGKVPAMSTSVDNSDRNPPTGLQQFHPAWVWLLSRHPAPAALPLP